MIKKQPISDLEHKDGKSTAFKQSLRILDLRHFRVHRGRIKKAEIRFITLNINCEFYKIYNIVQYIYVATIITRFYIFV